MAKKKTENKTMTRAQKTEAVKGLVKGLLATKTHRHNELIDAVAKLYTEQYHGEDTENANDVKGRVGSVIDIMKKESEVMYEGGMYALKARLPIVEPVAEAQAETPVPKKRKTAKKAVEKKKEELQEEAVAEIAKEEKEDKAVPKKRGKAKKTVEVNKEKLTPPTAVEETPLPTKEEKPAPKKRGRKSKTTAVEEAPIIVEKTEQPAENELPNETIAEEIKEVAVETPKEQTAEEKKDEVIVAKEEKKGEPEIVETPKAETVALVEKPKAELTPKPAIMDMSFLFGAVKNKAVKMPEKEISSTPKQNEMKEQKETPKSETKAEIISKTEVQSTKVNASKNQEKPLPDKKTASHTSKTLQTSQTAKVAEKKTSLAKDSGNKNVKGKQVTKPITVDEKLQEAFLKRMRTLGGDYFEYYSVYLLERYSMKNGRRLEGLRISGGDHDGGIDGEIELTDKFGFKETIYIQSKNWDPEKGKEDKWVVGETLLQQFIGACACRQAKDGKQHCRGIFVTTSKFTPEAKRILNDMSDKIVGYDGEDLYEAAKECEFGLIKKNGEWTLDEKLLSGEKAFFNMF